MDGTGRAYLKEGQTIRLSAVPDRSVPEEFEIRYVLGEGGTAVCYEARRLREGYSETGKLKEFYPMELLEDYYGNREILRRNPDGQLTAADEAAERFSFLCQEYLDTYRMLWKVMENPEHEILRNYIQIGDFFYGTRESSAVYIWSPGVAGVGLDQYIDELREAPEKQAEYKLNSILRMMIALTNCVRTIHIAGMMHLDIKPANFIVPYDSYMRPNPDAISMFDINTLYSMHSDFSVKFAGTKGYRAPEVLRGRADNRSDIYSIGAILFRGIVISENPEMGFYQDDFYDSIDVLVKNSGLMTAAAANSDYRLVQMLAEILKNCLAKNPGKRYESCSDLLSDLEAALKRASIDAESRRILTAEAGKPAGDPGNAIRKLLYEHPLYEALPVRGAEAMREQETVPIHVLVAGSGTYGQKFIDLCLQAGQMRGYSLHITAVSDAAEEDRRNYLQFRPDIRRFIRVNGSMEGAEKEAYGTLDFCDLPKISAIGGAGNPAFQTGHSADAAEVNRALVSRLVAEASDRGFSYDYIFVALRDDELNRQVAELFAGFTGRLCPVCFVQERENSADGKNREFSPENTGFSEQSEEYGRLCPVFVGAAVTVDSIDPQLEQMAFNTNLSWNPSLNLDVSEEYRKFCANPYHRASSLSFALSIKYKLFSIGVIAVDDQDWTEEAQLFYEKVLVKKETDAGAKEKFDILVWLEHRRWVLSLVTEGWTAPLDENGRLCLEACVSGGKVNDPLKRMHPCLVPSQIGSPLDGEDYTRDGHAKWEEEPDPHLDELDRMSLDLHRLFRARTEKLRQTNPIQNGDMEVIRHQISHCEENIKRAYRQFCYCLKNILNGVEGYTRQYENYKNAFCDTLDGVPEQVRQQIKDRLALVDRAFFPVIEANLYRNYKKNDEILIDRIPFILTYHFQPSVAMAFEDGRRENGRNEAVFGDVAAATVLSPEKICYLYCMERDSSAELLRKKISAVLHYLGNRRVHSKVTFTVACTEDADERERRKLESALESLKETGSRRGEKAALSEWVILPCTDRTDAAAKLLDWLGTHPTDLYDGSTQLFPSAFDNGAFAAQIPGLGIPYFEFDWRKKRFSRHIGCDYLQYIKDDSYIRIDDMFSLMKAENRQFGLPEFMDDYETLWAIYTGKYMSYRPFENGVRNWNRLCMTLKQYEESRKPLAVLPVLTDRTAGNLHLVFELPAYTFRTVHTLLEKLIRYRAVGADSVLYAYTSESCRLEIDTDVAAKQTCCDLFSQVSLFLDYYGIDAETDGETVRVICNRMEVTGVNLDPDGNGNDKYSYKVLERLEDAHYITRLTREEENPALVSFVYSAPRIKQLLTSAGAILEIYAYYQVLKIGWFDDVATGYEFYWEEGGVKNELDLVLTKGFRSMIVECKAVQKLDLEYYHKLHSIADHFGIGTIKVLIGNTYRSDNEELNAANRMQRSRGSQLNILTISDPKEIENIGETLKNLMEEGSEFI